MARPWPPARRASEGIRATKIFVLFLIFLILYVNTKSIIKTAIVLSAVPFSIIGSVWLLYVLHYNWSIAVWVGLIALAGLSAETGVVMLVDPRHGLTELDEILLEVIRPRVEQGLKFLAAADGAADADVPGSVVGAVVDSLPPRTSTPVRLGVRITAFGSRA